LIKYNEKEKKEELLCVCEGLNKWVTSSCGNTALIAFVTAHLDITFVSPTFTPAGIRRKKIIDKIIKK
jgi:hypothetical protein